MTVYVHSVTSKSSSQLVVLHGVKSAMKII